MMMGRLFRRSLLASLAIASLATVMSGGCVHQDAIRAPGTAGNDVQGKTELEAVIAYLQVLGLALK